MLWADLAHKLSDQVLIPLNTYQGQFPEMRVREGDILVFVNEVCLITTNQSSFDSKLLIEILQKGVSFFK